MSLMTHDLGATLPDIRRTERDEEDKYEEGFGEAYKRIIVEQRRGRLTPQVAVQFFRSIALRASDVKIRFSSGRGTIEENYHALGWALGTVCGVCELGVCSENGESWFPFMAELVKAVHEMRVMLNFLGFRRFHDFHALLMSFVRTYKLEGNRETLLGVIAEAFRPGR